MVQAQPVQQDNSFAQTVSGLIQYGIGEKRRQQALQYEDEVRKNAIMQKINPAALSQEFDPQVVNQTMAELHKAVSEYKGDHNSAELQDFINQSLQKTAKWSNNVKAVRAQIDKTFSQLGDVPYDKASWYKLAVQNALYKDGRLKSAEEIDPNEDYVADTFKNNGEALIDIEKTNNLLYKGLKEAPKQTRSFSLETQNGLKKDKEKYTAEHPNFIVIDDKTGKKMANMTPEIIQQYAPAGGDVDHMLTARAHIMLGHNNIPDTPENIDKTKKDLLRDIFLNADSSKVTRDREDRILVDHSSSAQNNGVQTLSPAVRAGLIAQGDGNYPGADVVVDGKKVKDFTNEFAGVALYSAHDGSGSKVGPSSVIWDPAAKLYKVTLPDNQVRVYTAGAWQDVLSAAPGSGSSQYVPPKKVKESNQPAKPDASGLN